MILHVRKDHVAFDLEVAERTSDKFPLWDPELFAGATVHIGARALLPAEWLVVTADVWLKRAREHREHERVLEQMRKGRKVTWGTED